MQLNMHLCIAAHTHTYKDVLCFDTCQEKTEFLMLLGSSPYVISSVSVQLKGKRVNFLNFSILF